MPGDGQARGRAYASFEYAKCLEHVGTPLRLERSGLTLLARPIPASSRRDLVGPYPLLPVAEPAALVADLDDLARGEDPPVSFVAVTDPLVTRDTDALSSAFGERARPFKRHFLVDPRLPEEERVSKHHAKELRRARRFATFEVVDGERAREDWVRLYTGLVDKLGLTGASAFPAASLAAQLELDGALCVRAVEECGRVTAIALMLRDGPRAWYHLAAQDDVGRKHQAGYGALAEALRRLANDGVEVVDLGAAAGLEESATDGLAKFKSGFAGSVEDGARAEAWLLGRVLDDDAYRVLSGDRDSGTSFFPAYRAFVEGSAS